MKPDICLDCIDNDNGNNDHTDDIGTVYVTDSLTLKAPTTTAADDIHKYFFIVFQRK